MGETERLRETYIRFKSLYDEWKGFLNVCKLPFDKSFTDRLYSRERLNIITVIKARYATDDEMASSIYNILFLCGMYERKYRLAARLKG
jgi:hypothetical protein